MNHRSLKDRLTSFLKRHYTLAWIASGDLQRIVAASTKYTPQNVGRRLRELENEGVVEVRHEKNHAFYRFRTDNSVQQQGLDWSKCLPA